MAKDKKKDWIAGAVNPANKGALRSELGAKKGKDISAKKLDKAAKSSDPKLRERAQFAKNMKKINKDK